MSYNHTHSEAAAYDEYKTDDGKTRITVITEKGEFKLLELRLTVKTEGTGVTTYVDVEIDTTEEIEDLLTALHAAVAGINKRKAQ